jgi:hypothetical protein
MGKLKETLIDEITPENIPEVQEEYIDPNRCKCGGTFVLIGRSQDANKIYSILECDLCKATKHESKAKG